MIKLTLLYFIFLNGAFLTSIIKYNANDTDLESSLNCIESEYNSDLSEELLNGGHGCEHSEQPVWKVTYKSTGEWECETGGTHQCFPCNTEPEEN